MGGGRKWLSSSGADRYLSESQVEHESLLSHGCEEGTRHRGLCKELRASPGI